MEKPYKYDEWKKSLGESKSLNALETYASVVEQFLQCPTGHAAKSNVENASLYIKYYLYETSQQ